MKKTLAVLKTDPITHQVEKPDILLQRRDGKVLGKVLYDNLNMSISGSALDEVNFDVYKTIDGKRNPLWDDIVDLKLINIVGFKRYEITISKTDTNDTIKNVTGTSLECELARPLYDLHINDEDYFEYQSDDNMDSYGNIIPIKYYNPIDEKHSLLHLLLADKAPDWSIGHVPEYLTVTNLGKKDSVPSRSFQRTFTIDGQTIYDFLVGDLASETNTVYEFDTYNRIINIYDKFEIGEDTNTFINNRNLANSIKIEGNADSLKNCFKVIGGDDVITNYLAAVNLTGNYIWKFSDLQYNDMPTDLANAIKEYLSYKDQLNDEYYGGYDVFNKLIESGKTVDTTLKPRGSVTDITSLPAANVDNLGDYYYVASENKYYVSNGESWEICGAFTRLCSAYDYMSYLTDTMMPSISLSSTTAKAQASILQQELESTSVAVNNMSIYNSNSFDGVTNNVIAYAKVVTDSRYKVENVKEISSYPSYSGSTWTGKIKLTKYTDENDTVTFTVSVNINDDEMTFAKQKIMKALANNSMTDVDDDVLAYTTSADMEQLIAYFQKYCLNSLQSFYNGYQACISVLMSLQSSSHDSSVYDTLYNTYRIRLSAVEQVYHIRQVQVDDQQLLIDQIVAEKNAIQSKADFKTYLNNINPTYWKLFNSYRREDTYQNDNYVSDGLTDGQIIAKCKELLEYANYQISMACQLQRILSVDMNNLMIMEEFEPFWDKFAIYNYIRVQTDDEVLKLRLMQIDIDFNNVDQLNVSFAENISGNGNVLNNVADAITQMNNIATSYNSTKQQVEQSQYKISQVGEWINNGLNASKVMITTSDENEVTVNNYGINLKDMSDEGNYGSSQTRVIGKGIFFTTDNWDSVECALGQIYIKDSESDGHFASGIIAKNVIGDLIAGQSLKITNQKGSVVIDGDTAKFTDICIDYNDSNNNYVHIGGDSSRIFAIGHDGVEQMYFNSELNKMVYSGDVIAATITGGSINIGSGNFVVDGNGNMTANNGTLKGTIESSIINGSTINTGTIIGGTVSGAIITSSGSYGTTTISGGTIECDSSGQKSASIKIKYGDYENEIMPYGQVFYYKKDATTLMGDCSLSINADGIVVYTKCSTVDRQPHSTEINSVIIKTHKFEGYRGELSSCDGTDYSIPNVSWIKNNIISQKTPTSTATTDADKEIAPSYYACAGMIDNIKDWVKDVMPSTSNFATKSDLSNYSPKGHTHNQYVSNVSVSSSSSTGTKFVHDASVSGNTLYLTRYVYSASDIRLKQNVSDLPDLTQIYMKLEPKKFKYSDVLKGYSKDWKFGLIAQDMERLFYEANIPIEETGLITLEQSDPVFNEDKLVGNDVVHRINYDQFHVMHIQMIQKQQEEIESLKQQNISLEGRISILERIVDQLSA